MAPPGMCLGLEAEFVLFGEAGSCKMKAKNTISSSRLLKGNDDLEKVNIFCLNFGMMRMGMGDGDDHDENQMMRVVMITVALLLVRTVKPQPSNL